MQGELLEHARARVLPRLANICVANLIACKDNQYSTRVSPALPLLFDVTKTALHEKRRNSPIGNCITVIFKEGLGGKESNISPLPYLAPHMSKIICWWQANEDRIWRNIIASTWCNFHWTTKKITDTPRNSLQIAHLKLAVFIWATKNKNYLFSGSP